MAGGKVEEAETRLDIPWGVPVAPALGLARLGSAPKISAHVYLETKWYQLTLEVLEVRVLHATVGASCRACDDIALFLRL